MGTLGFLDKIDANAATPDPAATWHGSSVTLAGVERIELTTGVG